MWIALAIAAAAFIVAFALIPKPKVENARAANLDQFNLPRSNEGDPVPLIKGTVKLLSPNTIWSGAFRSEAITKKVSTGLFSSKNQITGYRYYLGLDLALCLGPNVSLKRIWFGEKVVWSGANAATNSPFQIRVYKDSNYRSKELVFTGDVPNLNSIGLNDGISSFKAFGTWDLFENANYTGATIRVRGDNANLAGTFLQDKISSMRRFLAEPGNVGGLVIIDLPNFHGGEEGNGGIGGTCEFYSGSMNQLQSPYLAQQIGAGVPAYHGTSHFVMRDFYVGNTANIEAVAFELQCFSNSLGLTNGHNVMPNGLDENPIETLYDLYVTRWGKLGVDPAYLDVVNFRAAAEVIWSENNGVSWAITTANTGGDLTREIIRQINAILYQDIESGKIRIKLIRQDYVVSQLPVLRPSNIIEITNYTKQLWDETLNQVRVKHRNRENNYQEAAALWQDFANINMQNKVRSTDISMPGVYTPELANTIAAREGAELNVPLMQCEFDANRTIANLRPGDVFLLNWPEYGIRGAIMRIRKFDTSELANGKIVVMCVQDEFSSKQVVFDTPLPSQWELPDTSPDPIVDFALLASPYFFRSQVPGVTGEFEALWALAARPDILSQSYDVITSLDVFSTSAASSEGTIYPGAGKLITSYPAVNANDDGFDDGVTGFIVGGFDGDFRPSTALDVGIQQEGLNVIYIGDEFLAYRTATVLGDGSYRLTNIRRALFDTTFVGHSVNANVFFITSIDGVSDTQFEATASVRTKLLDKAPGGRWREEDAVMLGPLALDSRSLRPAPPTFVTYEGVRQGSAAISAAGVVAWRQRSRLDTTVRFFDEATVAAEAGQDNRVRWRINASSWTTVDVTGNTVNIDTSAAVATDVLSLEVFSRRGGLLSRVPTLATITLTI